MDRLLRPSQADRATDDHTTSRLTLSEGALIEITTAKRMAGYSLNVSFSDGVQQVIDFEPFLQSSQNPLIREYLDPAKFAEFRVENGDLVWGDYGLCFPLANLYENRI